jgi:hypothetical protein
MTSRTHFLGTERIGQLSGAFNAPPDPDRPDIRLTDAMGWPLLNDLGWWGIEGVDMGPSTEHCGRLYLFFGDAIPTPGARDRRQQDTDPVAWTDDVAIVRHGGHVATGSWNFFLPNEHQPAALSSQSDWRLCRKCHALFWAMHGETAFSRCAAGGTHEAAGWNFSLLSTRHLADGSHGQANWFRCRKCQSLFWQGPHASHVCPTGGRHEHSFRSEQPALVWNYILPNDRQGAVGDTGQAEWRHCATCGMLFWNGSPFKGVCPGARGGGFRLNIVDRDGLYDEFTVHGAIGATIRAETPVGAFSRDHTTYVFVWVGDRQDPETPGSFPPAGSYLVSKRDPGVPGPYAEEELFGRLENNLGSMWQVSPVVVDNRDHDDLPSTDGEGVVLIAGGAGASPPSTAVRVAWMPAPCVAEPCHATMYLTDDPIERWKRGADNAAVQFTRPFWTSMSAAWLEGPRRWLVLYAGAADEYDSHSAVFARIAPRVTGLQSADEITVFDPQREGAWDRYIYAGDPPHPLRFGPPARNQTAPKTMRGWAYGAFLLQRFTEWDETTRELGLYYLLSTGTPYQVQVMHTRLRLGLSTGDPLGAMPRPLHSPL